MKKILTILFICSAIAGALVIPLMITNGINVSAKVITVVVIATFVLRFFVFGKEE